MEIAILVIQVLLKYGPDAAQSVQRMFAAGKEPTQAEWDALFSKALKPYDQYIKEAQERLKQ